MDDTKKMLLAIINGQSAMKEELLTEIKKVDGKVENLRTEIKQEFRKLTSRVDKIGLQVARLEDDTPTREEVDGLSERVGKLEQKIVS